MRGEFETVMARAGAGALDPRGPVAEAIADLWWLMLVLGAVVFVAFAALLGLALLRRWDPGADAEAAHRRLIGRWIVAGGVVMPFVVIVVVFVATLRSMDAVPATAGEEALEIEVIGRQFWYEVRYPQEGVVTANELHLPVGREVSFTLRSTDVIHSFWVPELGGKLDMMPGRTNTLVLQADQPGEYRARCAEFCGLQHARMGLVVLAEPTEDFEAWIADQRSTDAATSEAAQRGQQVFIASGCARCHVGPGVDRASQAGPDLRDLADRRTLAAATVENTRENLVRWISDPDAVKSGVNMPATDLRDEDLEALLAYLGYGR